MSRGVGGSCRPGSLAAVLACGLLAGCQTPLYTPNHANQGALLGGLAGAMTGAAIGDHNGETAAGALIGGAAGAFAGSAIGNQMDHDLARAEAEVQARLGRQLQGAVSSDDVIAMTRAGVSPSVILTQLHSHGVATRPDTNQVIQMSQQGVPEELILAMQDAPQVGLETAPAPPPPVTHVFVEGHLAPRFGPPHRRLGWRPPRHRH